MRWSRAQRSRAVPGYSTARRSRVRRARPAGVRGRRSAGRHRRRASGGEGTHRYLGSDAPLEIVRPTGRAHLERVPTGWSVDLDGAVDDAAAERSCWPRPSKRCATTAAACVRLWARAGDPVVVSAGRGARLRAGARAAAAAAPPPGRRAVGPATCARSSSARTRRRGSTVNNRAFAWHPEQGALDARRSAGAVRRALVRPGRVPAARGGRAPGRRSAGPRRTATSTRRWARST